MGKLIIHTRQDERKETLKTLIKLHCDYNDYLTNVFLPVWGFNDSTTKDTDKNESDQMGSSNDGDHPFFV